MSEKKEEVIDHPFATKILLPSRGKFYGEELPDGEVTIRPMTVQEEKLLLARADRQKLIDRLLQKCILSECIPMPEMLMTDKFFLLLSLRSITYGQEYTFTQACRSCGEKYKHTLSLPDGLVMKVANDEDVEPFDLKLPVSGKTLSLRFLRGKDEEAIDAYGKSVGSVPKEEGDVTYEYRLARHIVAIDGEPVEDTMEGLNFCRVMVGGDSLAMRREIAKRETGIELSVTSVCPSCKEEVTASVPLTQDFFPSSVS